MWFLDLSNLYCLVLCWFCDVVLSVAADDEDELERGRVKRKRWRDFKDW